MKDFAISTGPRAVKPSLLMLSHCVPSAEGRGSESARAWQLLATFGRTHDIHLACLADGPVSLAHWRSLHARTKQVVIEPARRLRNLLGRLVSLLAPSVAQSISLGGLFRKPVNEWSQRLPLDVVLCTRLALIEATRTLKQCERIIDLHQQNISHDARLSLCDTVVISEATQAGELASHNKRTMLVPAFDTLREGPMMRLATDENLEPLALPLPLKKAA